MNKKMVIGGIVVIVIIAIFIGVWAAHKHSSSDQTAQTNNEASNGNTSGSTTPATDQTATTSTSSAQSQLKTRLSGNQAYDAAVATYQASGYRIQFNLCQATPHQLVIKKGAKFMLDNRDDESRTIIVKSQTFHLGPYGYTIATAIDLGIYTVSCDGRGVMQLTVEK